MEQSRWGLAEALSQLKRVGEARAQYKKLADSHGRFAEFALLRLAALDNEQADHAAALVWLDRMAKETPHGALADRATLGRGYALYKLGRTAEAEAALSSILKAPSLAVDAHYWLGMSQFGARRGKRRLPRLPPARRSTRATAGAKRLRTRRPARC